MFFSGAPTRHFLQLLPECLNPTEWGQSSGEEDTFASSYTDRGSSPLVKLFEIWIFYIRFIQSIGLLSAFGINILVGQAAAIQDSESFHIRDFQTARSTARM